ncbi:hypothetical protein F10086_19 [Staphylococcus phage vB_SauM_JDF86]|nr:hypothetical protein F10086_19 [Staphylococcus phage vB_SauM_JDF86]
MKEELVQKLRDKVLQLEEERKEYKNTYNQCDLELSSIREKLEELIQDYNGTINLLNGSVYSAEKIDEEIKAYTGDYERTLRPLPLSRLPQIELTIKKDY